MPDPRVLVVTMAHNEEAMMPYFLRHYLTFAQEIWVFDNDSGDRTAEVASSFGDAVKVLPCPTGGLFDEDKLREVKSHSWKPRRDDFDWIVAVDVDELLHHPNMKDWLAESTALGASLLVPCGFDMVADEMPTGDGQIYDHVTQGVYSAWSSKPCCFDPKKVVELWLFSGSHWARPQGFVLGFPVPGLKLLHFHHMGPDHVEAKYIYRRNRVAPGATSRGFLTYRQGREEIEARIAEIKKGAFKVL